MVATPFTGVRRPVGRSTRHRRAHQKKPHDGRGRAALPPVAKPPVDRVVLVLSAFGLLLTAYLSIVAWGESGAAFCTEGSGCDVVQGSRWSRFLGLPIAAWGFALYAALAWTAARPAPKPARWRKLWRLAFWGLAISVYLTLAGWIALQALCAWCLASLATLAAIFAVVHVRKPDHAPGVPWPTWLLGNGLVVLALLAALQMSAMGLLERRENPRLRALAEHLQASGAKFYGASWCANCVAQKREFGAASGHLPYVECSPDGRSGGIAFECTAAGIGSYPTWMIGGQPYVGVIEPERLAKMTGFDWERPRGD